MSERNSDSSGGQKTRGQDIFGLVLAVVGGFAAVSIFLSLRGQESSNPLTAPVDALIASLGPWAGLVLSLGVAGLGVTLFLRIEAIQSTGHLLGWIGTACGVSLMVGAVSPAAGGVLGGLLPGWVGTSAGLFVGLILGLLVMVGSAWTVWLDSGTRRPKVPAHGAMVPTRQADAEGVSAAEAQALQPVREPTPEAGAVIPPVDVRLKGGVPAGTQPLVVDAPPAPELISEPDVTPPPSWGESELAQEAIPFDEGASEKVQPIESTPQAFLRPEPAELQVEPAPDVPVAGPFADAPIDAVPAPSWERAEEEELSEPVPYNPPLDPEPAMDLAAELAAAEREAAETVSDLDVPAEAELAPETEETSPEEATELEEAAELDEDGELEEYEEEEDDEELEEAAELDEDGELEEYEEEEDDEELEEAAELDEDGELEEYEEEEDDEELEEAAELDEDGELEEYEEEEADEELEEAAELDEEGELEEYEEEEADDELEEAAEYEEESEAPGEAATDEAPEPPSTVAVEEAAAEEETLEPAVREVSEASAPLELAEVDAAERAGEPELAEGPQADEAEDASEPSAPEPTKPKRKRASRAKKPKQQEEAPAAFAQVGLFDNEEGSISSGVEPEEDALESPESPGASESTGASADSDVLVPVPPSAAEPAHASGSSAAESATEPSGTPSKKAKGKSKASAAKPAAEPVPAASGVDANLIEAGRQIIEENRVAVSMLQRRFGIEFQEACEMLDRLQEVGLIGPYVGGRNRDILLSAEEWEAMNSGATAS